MRAEGGEFRFEFRQRMAGQIKPEHFFFGEQFFAFGPFVDIGQRRRYALCLLFLVEGAEQTGLAAFLVGLHGRTGLNAVRSRRPVGCGGHQSCPSLRL